MAIILGGLFSNARSRATKRVYSKQLARENSVTVEGKVFGYLIDKKEGKIITVGEGFNALSIAGIRVTPSALAVGGGSLRIQAKGDSLEIEMVSKERESIRYQTNDIIHLEGRHYLLKILPEKYRLPWKTKALPL